MRYLLICLLFSSCVSNSNTNSLLKSGKEKCFESGGSEYYDSQYSNGPGSYCVYKSNSCRLDK